MYEWISVGEASRRLNVSPSTVRRMIEAGALVGERQVIGGSRERFLVRFDAPPMPHDASGEASDGPVSDATTDASTAPYEASGALLGLLAELREMRRQEDERRTADASRIADLREERGWLQAERDAAAARAQAAEAELQRLRGRSLWKPWTW